MNSTNRGLNRFVIIACGLLLLVLGSAAAIAVLVPAAHDAWPAARSQIEDRVSTALQQTPLGTTGVSWIMPAILLVLLVLIVLLIVFISRQGRGRTDVVVREGTSDHGTTVIDAAVAEQAIQDALRDRPELVASHVSAYRVRRRPVLKISVTCRRGVSPRLAASIVEDDLLALDALLGRELPALIQISGGFRSRVRASTRLQ